MTYIMTIYQNFDWGHTANSGSTWLHTEGPVGRG